MPTAKGILTAVKRLQDYYGERLTDGKARAFERILTSQRHEYLTDGNILDAVDLCIEKHKWPPEVSEFIAVANNPPQQADDAQTRVNYWETMERWAEGRPVSLCRQHPGGCGCAICLGEDAGEIWERSRTVTAEWLSETVPA